MLQTEIHITYTHMKARGHRFYSMRIDNEERYVVHIRSKQTVLEKGTLLDCTLCPLP